MHIFVGWDLGDFTPSTNIMMQIFSQSIAGSSLGSAALVFLRALYCSVHFTEAFYIDEFGCSLQEKDFVLNALQRVSVFAEDAIDCMDTEADIRGWLFGTDDGSIYENVKNRYSDIVRMITTAHKSDEQLGANDFVRLAQTAKDATVSDKNDSTCTVM